MWRPLVLLLCLSLVLLPACQTTSPAPEVAQTAKASLRLAALFTDNMVLQQGQRDPVWGWAEPGTRVTVAIAGQSASAKADELGKWKAVLKPLDVGGPHEMTISAGSDEVILTNVMVGEVWVGSGQSNMQMPVKVGTYGVMNGEQEIAAANYPNIRLFTVPMKTSFDPLDDIAADGWKPCGPETVPGFSAALYFFGRQIHQEVGVPVGLIHTSWGGTLCEAWTSEVGLRTMPEFATAIDTLVKTIPEIEKMRAEYEDKLKAWNDSLEGLDAGYQQGAAAWTGADFDASAWPVMKLPTTWENAGVASYDGSMWFRKEVDIPAAWAGKELQLHLGPINDTDRTWFNGQEIGRTEGPGQATVPRVYTVPGALVKADHNAITVRVYDLGNVGGIYGDAKELFLAPVALPDAKVIPLAGEWRYQAGLDISKAPPKPELPVARKDDPNVPTVLFNAMINPLLPYGIQGAIWYQGESNAPRAHQYQTLFPTMIRDWRQHWGQGDFPFIFVQLANFTPRKPDPGEDAWAELREAQTMTLAEPNTGMAVIIDIGEADDIHPKNKQDVGLRLALPALANVYGQKIEYSGPMYREMKVEGSAIRVSFDHVGGGLMSKQDPIKGFAIAGEDKKFVWADAKIDGDTVVVSSPQVPAPAAVRYGWAANPEVSLYNNEGLPASPFRTDTWPGITFDKK